MPDLSQLLAKANRLLFIGVGNVLKRDDGAGVVISRQIKQRPNISSLTVEVSIENYIGKINSMEPGEIVILDCMDMGAEPGTSMIVALDELEDVTFNTHNISLGRLADFFHFPTYVLGIQPLSIDFGDELSQPVQETVAGIVKQINRGYK